MRLLLIGTIGDSKFVSNLGTEVEIKILDIKNNSVLFQVSSKKPAAQEQKELGGFEGLEQMFEKASYGSALSGITDLVFLKKQAD